MSTELTKLSALAVRDLLAAGEISSVELVEAAAARLAVVEPQMNAVPTLCLDRAREQARAADVARRAGRSSLLGGLPIVVKDNSDVEGVRNTGGTSIFRDRISTESDRTVALMEANGAITLGKSNLSELGGAQTTNSVHGATRNPYDRRLTCGGSSGGAAVALATGEAWLAHGNDYGGSLRIPAAFCNVTGLRPTPGRVPRKRLADPFDTIAVEGPMARDVVDLALFFDAMTGYDSGDILTAPTSEPPFLAAALTPRKPARVAVSADLGMLPIEEPIRSALDRLAEMLNRAGVAVAHNSPDVAGAMDAFRVLRGEGFYATFEPLFETHRHAFPAPVLADLLRGRDQPGNAIVSANRFRSELYRRTVDVLDEHDFLICPATQVMPFSVETLFPETVAGQPMQDYLDWISITAIWSLTGLPAIAIPIGFSREGLPVGVQILSHARREADLFRLAAWIERELALPIGPIDPR
ncbi:amidase [Bosea robiniae]|uniref:Indoleacetamide hydrolase n=1 Tax=Bosea robiniae TaxID=1036780 RepID=A0ABY0P6E5_9HYPH|nr:amidase [Bosea robiniae]SDH50059.1 amidase [Bosea robiniae]